MKRCLVVLALVALACGPALAAPGDPRVVQGVLQWPANLSTEPFIVLRGEDGRLYYADIAGAQRRAPGALAAGSPVAVLGVEGNRPYELAALVFGAGDAASLGMSPPPGGPAPAASIPSTAAAPGASVEAMWRLDGTVQSIAAPLVTVRTDDGRTQTVDVALLSPGTIRTLRAGDRVALFGVERPDDKLVANGLIQAAPAAPAASPPTR